MPHAKRAALEYGWDSRTETSVYCCDGGMALPGPNELINTRGQTEQPQKTQAETGDVQLQLSSCLVKGQHRNSSKSFYPGSHIAVVYRSRTDDVEALQSGGECVRAQNS